MRRFSNTVNDTSTIAFLLVLELLALIGLTATWQISTTVVLAFSFVGGTIGSLSCVVLVPFVTKTHPSHIEDALLGMRGLPMLSSAVGLMQQPGSQRMHFTSTVFLGAFILPTCCTFWAFRRIQQYCPAKEEELREGRPEVVKLPTAVNAAIPTAETALPAPVVLESSSARKTSLQQAWPLISLLGWANFNCFGLVPAILPFAAKHTDSNTDSSAGAGSECLQYALLLGSIALSFGSVAAMIAKCRRVFSLSLVYTLCTGLIYCAAFDFPRTFWSKPLGAPLLVATNCMCKFLESYLVTMIYILISERFPTERISISRAAGFFDRAATTVGTLCSIGLLKALSSADVAHAHACF
jgi:hypothetical protein